MVQFHEKKKLFLVLWNVWTHTTYEFIYSMNSVWIHVFFGMNSYCLVWAKPKTITTSAILYLIKFLSYHFTERPPCFMAPIESCWRALSNNILVDIGVQNLTPNHPFPHQNTGIAASDSFWPSPPRNSYPPSYNHTINSFIIWTISWYCFNVHFWVDCA